VAGQDNKPRIGALLLAIVKKQTVAHLLLLGGRATVVRSINPLNFIKSKVVLSRKSKVVLRPSMYAVADF
jgi:hypothetical protein